jgi:tRNA modification GTPase
MNRPRGEALSSDTIAAVATAPGRSAIGILRVSGPAVPDIARQLLGRLPPPRQAMLASFRDADGAAIDQGLALYFPAPHSYSGEDMLELQGHGNPVIIEQLLARLHALGARAARPGEFSSRAFLNGKLDLAQAEAVADLIASDTAQAARGAMVSLAGGFSQRVAELARRIDGLRAEVEAWLDFPEEDPRIATLQDYARRASTLADDCSRLIDRAREGQLLRDGLRVVLAGRPNAGKSSLFNRLLDRERAIVSPIPGTTRDTLEATVSLRGIALHLTDTAGLRDAGDDIEREGMRRTREVLRESDHLLLLVPAGESISDTDRELLALPAGSVTLLRTKRDLTEGIEGSLDGVVTIAVSVLTGDGLPALFDRLVGTAEREDGGEGAFTARRRHIAALAEVCDALRAATGPLEDAQILEVAAEHLRRGRAALSLITGEFTTEDLLGEIFSQFCIGK